MALALSMRQSSAMFDEVLEDKNPTACWWWDAEGEEKGEEAGVTTTKLATTGLVPK